MRYNLPASLSWRQAVFLKFFWIFKNFIPRGSLKWVARSDKIRA
ncbi:hypothetical protein [Oscillospiraceae bacterium]|nr:hypothetical protein [Oscillospiraceae bacterium]